MVRSVDVLLNTITAPEGLRVGQPGSTADIAGHLATRLPGLQADMGGRGCYKTPVPPHDELFLEEQCLPTGVKCSSFWSTPGKLKNRMPPLVMRLSSHPDERPSSNSSQRRSLPVRQITSHDCCYPFAFNVATTEAFCVISSWCHRCCHTRATVWITLDVKAGSSTWFES